MFKKFVFGLASCLCLLCAFIAYSLSFFGTDLKTLRTYPAQTYPQHLYDALVAAEDPNYKDSFWQRNSCLITNNRCGSSLRQMAVKHLTLEHSPEIHGTSMNLHVALAMPRANLVVKNTQFLDYILDHAYFGKQINGIRAAAHVHFETPITEVSIAQAAALVSLLKAPSSLNRNPEKLRERTVSVLNTMYAKKFITSDQLETAIKETASSFF